MKKNLSDCLAALAKSAFWQNFWPGISRVHIRRMQKIEAQAKKAEAQVKKIAELAQRREDTELLAILNEIIDE